MRVLTFSTKFPVKHTRAGEPTFFVEQIYNALETKMGITKESVGLPMIMYDKVNDFVMIDGTDKKFHTIRAGNRWKVGDWFSARIWSGKPYASKQIEFAQIQIQKIWTFRISHNSYYVDEQEFLLDDLTTLAKNDGLSVRDFEDWFSSYPKKGQPDFIGTIICWNENINY